MSDVFIGLQYWRICCDGTQVWRQTGIGQEQTTLRALLATIERVSF